MKTINQIRLIKLGYITTLVAVVLFSLNDASRGFADGYQDAGSTSVFGVVKGLFILLICFLSSRVFVYLYRFINSVEVGNVFTEENSKLLNRIGWYCTIMPFLVFVFNGLEYLQQSSIHKDLLFDIVKNVDFQIWLLIFGLTILTIAFVFKKGIELKQENDLTI
ncbi:DUF2975 domain-containing protein [Pedobacter frigidisoli]|uniref:DUF2975 domain-containing protein n=1 Tax=Pedobacter frigidisoli TaxID=2530455 RepID=A0A4R0P5H4_9SPHI|nr:DUF2975 domain-containing protein [Pedobacter frigidisoli]TCD10603.1 DUF2975 domain-containing protein [Pedobacter frigidisoli]